MLKKDKKSLRLVHDLQPLNAVAIRDPAVPPTVETYAESFHAMACSIYLWDLIRDLWPLSLGI